MTNVNKRDIVWVTFPDKDEDEIFPEEMDDPHMAVVIQTDDVNNALNSTVVIPITTGGVRNPLREVTIPPHDEDVEHQSKAVLTQITTVSVPGRIFDEGEDEAAWKQGVLSREKMNEIEDRLGYLFGVGY